MGKRESPIIGGINLLKARGKKAIFRVSRGSVESVEQRELQEKIVIDNIMEQECLQLRLGREAVDSQASRKLFEVSGLENPVGGML